MNRILNFLYRLSHPRFWMTLYPVCPYWDAKLNRLLDTHTPSEITNYTCKVGTVTVWISNYPYAFGHRYRPTGGDELLPLPLTQARLWHAMRREVNK